MAAFWNENFLNKIRNNWLRRVAKSSITPAASGMMP